MPNLIFDYLKPESHGRLASKIHCFEAPFQVKPIRRTFSICIRAAQVLQHRRVQAAAHHQGLHRRLASWFASTLRVSSLARAEQSMQE
jgi:hypothetical protein